MLTAYPYQSCGGCGGTTTPCQLNWFASPCMCTTAATTTTLTASKEPSGEAPAKK